MRSIRSGEGGENMKKQTFLRIALLIVVGAVGGTLLWSEPSRGDVLGDWASLQDAARGSEVRFYGWGGDPRVNQWLDSFVAPRMKERYGITLRRVGMNIQEILNKLLSEKAGGRDTGIIDVVWINGENFYAARKGDLLFGPFTERLPHFEAFLDVSGEEVAFDFGFPTEGFESPWGRGQLVLFRDSSRLPREIRGYEDFLKAAREHPGEITYPAPPDFTGSAFVRTLICHMVGRENIASLSPDKEILREAVAPAMESLRDLKPYLWMEGASYPATSSQLRNMYEDGELLLGMSYTPFLVPGKIASGEFSESTESFVFERGTVGNTHFLAIPFNAPNKAGAMLFINAMLDPEMQVSKYDPSRWGDLPVLDLNRLSPEERALFDSLSPGKGALPLEEILQGRIPELPASFIPLLDEIWREAVLQ
jgi:putative spermidine/putrescine transport system substrate-binding protein